MSKQNGKKRLCRDDEQPNPCHCKPCLKCPEGTQGVKKKRNHIVCLPSIPCPPPMFRRKTSPLSISIGTKLEKGTSEMVAKHAQAIKKDAEKILESLPRTITDITGEDNEANESTTEFTDDTGITWHRATLNDQGAI